MMTTVEAVSSIFESASQHAEAVQAGMETVQETLTELVDDVRLLRSLAVVGNQARELHRQYDGGGQPTVSHIAIVDQVREMLETFVANVNAVLAEPIDAPDESLFGEEIAIIERGKESR